MAWGDNVNTEDEAERIAAVREYFHEHIPNSSIRIALVPFLSYC